jgi:hypothetical protein
MTDDERIFMCMACDGGPGLQRQAGVAFLYCPHLRSGMAAPIGSRDPCVVCDLSIDEFNQVVFALAWTGRAHHDSC